MRILLALGAAIGIASSAQAVTIVNGSFENSSFAEAATFRLAGARQSLGINDTASLPGWVVFGSNISNVTSDVWTASAGSRSLDLSSPAPGGIMQRISGLTVGQTYRLTFDLSANPLDPDGIEALKRVLVSSTGNRPAVYGYQPSDSNSTGNMLYQTFSYDFQGVLETQNIRFSNLSQGEFGVVLDNVSIAAVALATVPEVTTWGMLLAGFALVGVASRRRRLSRSVTA